MKSIGQGSNLPAIRENESNSFALWVAGKWQAVLEMIPGVVISDEAARLRLQLLCQLAEEIGEEKFQQTIELAINTCERRPTIATMRRLAGVATIEPSAVTEAWELVTKVVTRHVQRDGNGMAMLAPKIKMVDGKAVTEPVPHIPVEVVRTVIAMGGFGSLAEAYPDFWGYRFQQFRDLYYNTN